MSETKKRAKKIERKKRKESTRREEKSKQEWKKHKEVRKKERKKEEKNNLKRERKRNSEIMRESRTTRMVVFMLVTKERKTWRTRAGIVTTGKEVSLGVRESVVRVGAGSAVRTGGWTVTEASSDTLTSPTGPSTGTYVLPLPPHTVHHWNSQGNDGWLYNGTTVYK